MQSRAVRRAEVEKREADRAALQLREAEIARERETRRRRDEEQQRRFVRIVSALLVVVTLVALVAVYLSRDARLARKKVEVQLAAGSFREMTVRGLERQDEALAFAARALRLSSDPSTRALTRALLVASPRLEPTFRHADRVMAVAWSPDGTRVATASADRTARMWDARTGQATGAPLQHANWVMAVAWSPDGTRVATASGDGTAQVWDARTARAVGTPLKHAGPLMDVAWSPDGLRVATASDDGTARVWDARSGQVAGGP